MHLSKAPATLLDMVIAEDGLEELKELTPIQREKLFDRLGVIQMLLNAGHGEKQKIIAAQTRLLKVSKQAIAKWQSLYQRNGFRGLVDGRTAMAQSRAFLPAVTKEWIKDEILRVNRRDAVAEVHRMVITQWNLWRRTGKAEWAIPGFSSPPPDCGKGFPAGFSVENFRRCQPTDYQKDLAAQGTQKAYRSLPSILSTRVGMSYLECVLTDDQQYDVHIRVKNYERTMRPLGFNSIDRLTAYPFPPHMRLRWYDEDEKKHRHLTQKEYVWYLIWFLCNVGYRGDEIGTRMVEEHGTAKSWANKLLKTPGGFSSFKDAVNSLTNGCVTIDSSGLFNKAAFAELIYGPQSAGNPRYKAGIESFFHVVRTYSNYLIGQSGRNIDEAPEENYGIDKIERHWFNSAKDIPEELRDGILSNYMTGIEFADLMHRIYGALASRFDHDMQGWSDCGFSELMWRWEEDPADMWRTRATLAKLPPHIRETAIAQQACNHQLSTVRPWSPAQAKAALENDPAIRRLNFSDAILLIPTEWAKEVKVRDRHQIVITDELLPGEELIYLPELTTPQGRKEYLHPGDVVMVYLNPMMPDTLLVCDQKFAFIGTLTRNIRIGRSNDQLGEMFAARTRLTSALDAPVRRAMQPVADRRDAVKQLNNDLIARFQEPKPEEPKPKRPKHGPSPADIAEEAMNNIPAPANTTHTDDIDV